MTLTECISLLELVASKQPAVRSICRDDVFKLNGRPDVQYGVFGWVQGVHYDGTANDIRRFAFNLFYIDRLTADKGNALDVQSTGVEVLGSVLRTIADDFGVGTWELHTFTQRFKDECAGVWASVTQEVPVSLPCGEMFEEYGFERGSFSEAYDAAFDVWRLTVRDKDVTIIK